MSTRKRHVAASCESRRRTLKRSPRSMTLSSTRSRSTQPATHSRCRAGRRRRRSTRLRRAARRTWPPPLPDHFDRHFDNADEWAKSFDDPARDAWQMPARVVEALQLKPGHVIADIGAGSGYFTVRLANSSGAPKVYAVDIEPSMVEYVTHRAMREGLKNVTAVLGGADRSNLPEPVDLVLVVDTYHHIPNRVAYFTGAESAAEAWRSAGDCRFSERRGVGPA